MQPDPDGTPGARRLRLDRETLHDLEPNGEQAALVSGGEDECIDGTWSSTTRSLSDDLTIPGTIPTTRRLIKWLEPGLYKHRTVIEAEFEVVAHDGGNEVIVNNVTYRQDETVKGQR